MIRKIGNYIKFLKRVRVIEFFYLNYFCASVFRTDNSKVIPYKYSIIDLEPNARIYVGGGDIEIGCNRMKKSRTETKVRLRNNSIWSSDGGCKISYGSTIEILDGAVLDTGYFTMNSGSTLVTAKKIVIGQDVMVGRNVVLYDSDFHLIVDEKGNNNFSKEVKIGNHVWIAANAMILKDITIGDGSIIAANTLVTKDVEEKKLVGNKTELTVLKQNVEWNR